WVPRAALLSASLGLFGDNRWGVSLGAARPVAHGALLFDAQADLTGFVSFGPGPVTYSTPDLRTGFGALTWRTPIPDVALRASAARFLGRDQSVELEVRRTMGDLDLGVFGQRSSGIMMLGVRLKLPLPPPARSTAGAFRLQLPERWPFEHRSGPGD